MSFAASAPPEQEPRPGAGSRADRRLAVPGVDVTEQGRARLGLEVLLVLGVSLGQSAVYSILQLVNLLTQPQRLSQNTTTLNNNVTPDRPLLDIAYQLAGVVFPVLPALLAIYLLSVTRRHAHRMIGFDLRRPGADLGFGVLIAACIGIPGLGIYLLARALDLDTTIAAANLSGWYAIAIYVLQAAMNGVLEEVIMIGFLYDRLRRLGWALPAIMITSAVIRGSYHLYQGWGGFAGNLIMGLVFGLIYLRWKRVMPLVVAHTILDVVSFVGYALAAPHLSWLR